jgi:energy-coupling factor transporter ATP-binding protein EcfA2
MRVSKLELPGIGPFEGAVFEIPEPAKGTGELVLFEGPNGCGKTTIVQAIACAAEPDPSFGAESVLRPPLDELVSRMHGEKRLPQTVTLEASGEILSVHDPRPWTKWFPVEGAKTAAGKLIWDYDRSARGQDVALAWAAFTYQGHQLTPVIATKGPAEIDSPALRGALSFGTVEPASGYFGQFLVNLDQEVAKAFREARRDRVPTERREEFDRLAASRQHVLDEMFRALSAALRRNVTFDVPVGEHAPTIFVDGEAIPLGLLGEGMRSTFAWLGDLLVRLHRIQWVDASRSPLEQDFWLILDEIDESLHPNMQAHIYPALRQLFPNARIYATTHSPFVVASVGEGVVFPIRPGRDHKVRGQVKARPLQPGESLELVTTDVFDAPAGFVDKQTREDIRAHDRDIQTLRKKKEIDWDAFMTRRDRLMALNEEVVTLVAMQEVPVKQEVVRRMRERIAAKEGEART